MDIRAAEISAILKQQIANFGNEAEVITARALQDGEIAELKSVLKAKLGREPRLNTRVDPALLGGLVVKVGSRMIDTSLRTKLDGLRAAMKGN
jgi:F-type H+-transporting ATPase subunit delta